MIDPRRALVLFSGGQDSTTCLAWALDRYAQVETIGFDYGQRHVVELECRLAVRAELHAQFPEWNERLGDDHLLDLSLLGQISDTERSCRTPSFPGATWCSSRWPARSPTGAASVSSSAACARPISPATPTAATTR